MLTMSSRRSRVRIAFVAPVALVSALVLAGCGSSGGSTAAPSVTPTPSVTSSATASPTATPSSTAKPGSVQAKLEDAVNGLRAIEGRDQSVAQSDPPKWVSNFAAVLAAAHTSANQFLAAVNDPKPTYDLPGGTVKGTDVKAAAVAVEAYIAANRAWQQDAASCSPVTYSCIQTTYASNKADLNAKGQAAADALKVLDPSVVKSQ